MGLLASCDSNTPPPPQSDKLVLQTTSYKEIAGWDEDDHTEALNAFLKSCAAFILMKDTDAAGQGALMSPAVVWREVCRKAQVLPPAKGDDSVPKKFFEENFQPLHALNNSDPTGLITGYYSPLLKGSRTQQRPYIYPVYGLPEAGTPSYTRSQIDLGILAGHAPVLAYVDDPVQLFFLHIQGSGSIMIDNSQIMNVGYAGTNGQPYTPIGQSLVSKGLMQKKDVTAPRLQRWLYDHPSDMWQVMWTNQSYVFFHEAKGGPMGTEQVPLTGGRSAAVDPRYIPLGMPIFIDTVLPETPDSPVTIHRKLLIAQDTGHAIIGPLRADIFFGAGNTAEEIAGRMKAGGTITLLGPARTCRNAYPAQMKRKIPSLDKRYSKHRPVTDDEKQLWLQSVASQKHAIAPKEPRAKPVAPIEKPSAPPSPKRKVKAETPVLDKATLAKIRRGGMSIEATLDLHGHTADAAHGLLIRFITNAQARGLRTVLVITGKGTGDKGGILRRLLPQWLNESALRGRIIAYDNASPRHGGSGRGIYGLEMPTLEPESKPHILVVDDDTRLRDLLKTFLRDQGLSVTVASDAKDARAKLALFQFDLMVLDVMMPGETGVEFARTLGEGAPPILLLTAMAEADDRINGLEAGADDYLVKPFEPRELVLRIQAILRRTTAQTQRNSRVSFGGYEFDLGSGKLQKNDELLQLTTSERQLLKALAENAGMPVTRETLAKGLGNGASERNVDVLVTRLRKKIEGNGSKPLYIQTVRGAGYVLHTDT